MDLHDRKRWNHRVATPADTLERLTAVLPKVGITRVAEVTRLDRIGIPVFQAIRPLSRLLTVSQGKGLTTGAARVSAIMESVEIWHAETFAPEGPRAAVADLAGLNILDPLHCLGPRYDGTPHEGPLDWVTGTDISHGGTVLVPRDVVNLDYTRAAEPHWISRNTNGLAGGNTVDEATSSALAEVIERGCRKDFARLNPHQRAARRLNPKRIARQEPVLGGLIEMTEGAGLDLELFDMTNRIGVTTIGASLYERQQARPVDKPSLGHGAHLDPVTAMVRAITEAAQTRLTHISGNRDDILPRHYEPANFANQTSGISAMMSLPDAQAELDLADKSGTTPREDVDLMVKAVLNAGLGPIIAVRLDQEDIGIPVVKVLAPVVSHGSQPGPGR